MSTTQRYTYRVLQTCQIKLILLSVWAERAVLGSAKTALKFKYEILQFLTTFTQLNARPKNFSQGWLLALSIKEGPVKCAIVSDKSWVILKH